MLTGSVSMADPSRSRVADYLTSHRLTARWVAGTDRLIGEVVCTSWPTIADPRPFLLEPMLRREAQSVGWPRGVGGYGCLQEFQHLRPLWLPAATRLCWTTLLGGGPAREYPNDGRTVAPCTRTSPPLQGIWSNEVSRPSISWVRGVAATAGR